MTIPVQAYDLSFLDPTAMAVLGYTATETLLYDYGNTELFYVKVEPPEVLAKQLYLVPSNFAFQWFFTQTRGTLTVVYNPFINLVAGTSITPPFQNQDFLLGSDGDFLLGQDGDALLGYP